MEAYHKIAKKYWGKFEEEFVAMDVIYRDFERMVEERGGS
jgi:hypothetical protein